MVDPELLEILVCPETKKPVRLADDEVLARVNRLIGEGAVKTRGGSTLEDALEAALVRDDGALLYPIRDDIPVMLVDEAVLLDDLP